MRLKLIFLASLFAGAFGGIPVEIEECLLDESKCVTGDRNNMCADYAGTICNPGGTCNQIAVDPHYFCTCDVPGYKLSADEHYCFYDLVAVASQPVAVPKDAPVSVECAADNNCVDPEDCIMEAGVPRCGCEDGSHVNEYEACPTIGPCSPGSDGRPFCFGDAKYACSKTNKPKPDCYLEMTAQCILSSKGNPECWCPGIEGYEPHFNGTQYTDYKIAFYADCSIPNQYPD